jgi:hypothetical protein
VTNLVSPDQIERIVGVAREPELHWGRLVSSEKIVYILHSQACKDATADLRDCPYSLALDLRTDFVEWPEDQPVVLTLRIVPVL